MWREGEGFKMASGVIADDVFEQIDNLFANYTYAGVQYAPWELTRVKYHRLDSQGVQYFYKQSDLMVRFIAWPGLNETKVFDFPYGFISTDFTEADFSIYQYANALKYFSDENIKQ